MLLISLLILLILNTIGFIHRKKLWAKNLIIAEIIFLVIFAVFKYLKTKHFF
jgi:hypothetical protein